ncbi:DegT/DnrJ/EryC1/StrS family aminotransferase [Myxococcota bacterium]|nr:DegT/DnrJ/EryC1/StrS family aminotransferase [Myxococcota bacterium]
MSPDPAPGGVIHLHRPTLGEEEARAIAEALESGQLVQGPRVRAFEAALEGLLGVPHAAAVSSGTAALHLAALALDLGPGDEVVVPDYTFPATAAAFARVGASPVLADVDPDTANVTPATVEAVLSPRTRALVAVHQFGLPAPVEPLRALCDARGIAFVEDAACALGAEVAAPGGPRRCGTFGRLACFSFHPRKAITTAEGGLVTTADPALDARIRLLRNHGMTPGGPTGFVFVEAGLNYRLTEVQAAMGLVQLGRLGGILAARRRLSLGYRERLEALLPDLGLPADPEGAPHTYQTFLVRLPPGVDRAGVMADLREAGVESSVGAHCLHRQPAYSRPDPGDAPFPGASSLGDRGLALPLHPGLGDADLDRVVSALAGALGR